jgi:hypothetical protein
MTDLAERGSLGFRENQSAFQLVFQDAVFGGQIFVPGRQPLVHRPRNVGQDARPIHNGLFAPIPVVAIAPKNVPERLLQSATFSRGMAEGPWRRRRKLGTPTSYLEPFEHDLAARFFRFPGTRAHA